jgi:transposase
MIDLYKSGTTAKQVAEKFGISVRSVTRLLRQHGVRREGRATHITRAAGRQQEHAKAAS